MQNWYALYTKSRHEKHINEELDKRNIESFLPLRKIKRRWSDRVKTIEELQKRAGEGIVVSGWCGEKDCAKPIDEAGTILSISEEPHECATCGGRGKKIIVAKTY